jgi:hypothetical protein
LFSHVTSTVLNRDQNAAFLTSCHEHCGQWGQGQLAGQFSDFNVSIDGYSAAGAMDEWFGRVLTTTGNASTHEAREGWTHEGHPNLWLQKAVYPCTACCNGGQ